MKIKILKGTNQIGGCITEITSNAAKIIIDFGLDLPEDNKKEKNIKPMIKGLTYGNKDYDAVFITHNHNDHIGLISYIIPEIPIYVEKTSKKIYDVLNNFMNINSTVITIDMLNKKPIIIKNITITPYIVDHSAYNSVMLLIESDGKRILHTGDFRGHGYKGKNLQSILDIIGTVDVVITEGTSFSRNNVINKTEQDLSKDIEKIMKNYNQIFSLQSGTNVDRITTIYKAAQKAKKIFIEDIFVANITVLTNSFIPNPITFDTVYTYIPQNRYISSDKNFKEKYIEPFKAKTAIYKMFHNDYVMNIRINMIKDLKKFKEKGLITNAVLIYSMWDGYKEKKEFKLFLDEIKELGIDVIDLHTSGHADITTIRKMLESLKPDIVIPIHTTNKKKILEISKKGIILEDNEELEV